MNRTKTAALLALVIVSTSMTACAMSKTDASSGACVYNGGPLDNKNFRGYVEPGAGREMQGFASDIVEFPDRVVQYSMKTDGTGDINAAITVKVKGVDQSYQPTLTFKLNSEIIDGKPVACDFIEKHLRPFDATDFNNGADSRWVTEFLNARLKPVVVDETIRVLQAEDPTALAQNIDGARDNAAEQIGVGLMATLRKQLGGDYFCAPDYRFGGPKDTCGHIAVVLPEPAMSAEDAALIAAPQRSKTEANNAIAVAREEQRAAEETATAREAQVGAEERRAAADKAIAEVQAQTIEVSTQSEYAWCAYLAQLGQDCALVQAAMNGDYPDVVGADPSIVVTPAAPETTIAP